MADESQAISDLAYVKEVIQALPPERKKEFLDHFVKYSNQKNQAAKTSSVRPSTPEPIISSNEFQKRPLNSPLTPKRNKKDTKVLLIIMLY
jgi:hypothetical protein